jgi:trimeric autotransporter adhesin
VGAYAEAGNASGVNGNQSDNSAATSGAAYAFTRSGTAWSQLAYLKASNPGAGDQFGYAVAASEGTAIIGAPYEDSSSTGVNGSQTSESATQAGAAYVFKDFVSLIPTVASVTPDSGRAMGDTLVTITGTNFTGASQVTFGGTPATDLTVINATSLTCITPPGNDGTVSVIVTTPYGSNAENTLFTYQNVAPDIAVTQADALVDGEGSVPFTAIIGSTETLTFTITNSGTEPLTNLVLTKDGMNAGDFTVSSLSGTSIPVGPGTVTFTVKFSPTIGGPKNAALHITSNVSGAKSSFDIALLGQALSHSQDSDGDGLNDASEYEMAVMGFDWRVSQTALVNTYYSSANGAGLYTPSQVQTLHIGTPLLQRNPTTGNFTLTIGVEKSSTLLPGSFSALPLTAPQTTINGAGKLEFQFPSTDRAAFYRLQVD